MQLSQWTFLDYIFAGIILLSIGLAVTKGLVRELVSLIALLGGFFLAVFYYPVAAAWFKAALRTDVMADLVGFMIIFVGVLALGALVAFLINRFVKAASLEWIDRLLGAIYGLLRGWAVASIIVLALVAFPVNGQAVPRSFLAPYLLAGARAAVLITPKELKTKFYDEYKRILQSLNEKRSPA